MCWSWEVHASRRHERAEPAGGPRALGESAGRRCREEGVRTGELSPRLRLPALSQAAWPGARVPWALTSAPGEGDNLSAASLLNLSH